MAETAFDRTERGLGSADLSVPDIVARTKGNPQDIMKLVMSGQITVTQGLLAKRLSDSVVAERNAMTAQQPNVLQEQFPELAQATGGLGAMPQAAPPMPAQMGPQMAPQGMPPQGMPPAQGGIGGLDFAPAQMAGGGIVGYQTGGGVAVAPQTDPFALQEVSLEEMLAGVRQNIPRKTDAMQRYREALEGSFDPEKAKKQAELSGIFAGLGSIRAGMSPMEALVSGFVGSGQQIQQAKKESKQEEMAMLKSVAELEGLENEMTRKDYELAYQLKQYNEGRLDKQQELRFEDKWNKEGNDTQIRARQIAAGAQIESARINAASYANTADKSLQVVARQAAMAAANEWADLTRNVATAKMFNRQLGGLLEERNKLANDTSNEATLRTNVINAEINRMQRAYIEDRVKLVTGAVDETVGGNRSSGSAEPIKLKY
jgi:hypothetical protein